jgi:hypothetical protein
VKNRAAGSISPVPVSVTRAGLGGSPRAARPSRRACERTSSAGSSRRMVPAPTMIASLPERTSSTRSRSASLDRISRVSLPSSRQPSTDIAADSSTNGRSAIQTR